jgi:hypothetical protein
VGTTYLEAHYNDGKIPQGKSSKGSFWWRDCTSLINTFKKLALCNIESGNSTLLWQDKWKTVPLLETYSQLHSFAKNKEITVLQAIQHSRNGIYRLFHLPLSMIAMQQCEDLSNTLDGMADSTNLDKCGFNWGAHYSTKKIYEAILEPPVAPAPFKWIWKSCCMSKHKFFFWLLLLDRLNTKDLMLRKNIFVESSECVLCQSEDREYLMHLFFECDFSQNFWLKLRMEWDTEMPLIDMLIEGKQRQNNICFREVLIVGCWSLWNHRNKIIFDNESISQDRCFSMFKESFVLIMHRAKPSLSEGMQQWIYTL